MYILVHFYALFITLKLTVTQQQPQNNNQNMLIQKYVLHLLKYNYQVFEYSVTYNEFSLTESI